MPDHVSFGSNNPGSKVFEEKELPRVGRQVMWPDHCVQGSKGAKFCDDLFRYAVAGACVLVITVG